MVTSESTEVLAKHNLLSGIATCTTCGGSLVAFTRDYKRGWGQRGRFYGCSFNHNRGAKVCANRILIRQDRLDRVVLDAIAEALDERLLERAVEKALQRLRRAPDRAKDRGPPSKPSCRSWRPACGRS
jgi:Recombinase zinc beta ribbon domain